MLQGQKVYAPDPHLVWARGTITEVLDGHLELQTDTKVGGQLENGLVYHFSIVEDSFGSRRYVSYSREKLFFCFFCHYLGRNIQRCPQSEMGLQPGSTIRERSCHRICWDAITTDGDTMLLNLLQTDACNAAQNRGCRCGIAWICLCLGETTKALSPVYLIVGDSS